MWSDPYEIDRWGLFPRGAGYQFGGDVVVNFNERNNLDLFARAHQLVTEGRRSMFTCVDADHYFYSITVGTIPSLIRAGNYCDTKCRLVSRCVKI